MFRPDHPLRGTDNRQRPGFETGAFAYAPEQQRYGRANSRRTNLLFMPSTAAMRADPRFAALVDELGLASYWKQSGMLPDYRKG